MIHLFSQVGSDDLPISLDVPGGTLGDLSPVIED
jgi:hypothetical protein